MPGLGLVGGLACRLRYGTGTGSWRRRRWRRPFVQGIASGKLAVGFIHTTWDRTPHSSIRSAALMPWRSAKSPDQDALIAFQELLDAAAEELRLHRGYAHRWNVDLHQAADPATAAYTNFLLAVCSLR